MSETDERKKSRNYLHVAADTQDHAAGEPGIVATDRYKMSIAVSLVRALVAALLDIADAIRESKDER